MPGPSQQPGPSRRRRCRGLAGHAAALAVGRWLLAGTGPPPPTPTPGGDARRLSVVIPARDEASSLPGLLDSLAAQTRPPDEVVVVDDHSADGTGALAAEAGATVVTPPPLPPGWLGKPWACHHGAGAAGGDLLLFLDADVALAPDALERLLAVIGARSGLVTVQPHHRTERAYEQLSAICNVVAVAGTGGFTGRPRRPMGMAFGPCLLLGRDTYELIGGHTDPSVRTAVCEDAAIAALLRARRTPVTAYTGGPTVRFRMYPEGPRQLVDGWSKMLAGGGRRAPATASVLTAVWVTGALLGAGRGARALRRHGAGWRRAGDAAVYAAWAVEMGWATGRVGRWWAVTAWLYPVPLAAFVALFARAVALAVTGRPATWRGRPVPAR